MTTRYFAALVERVAATYAVSFLGLVLAGTASLTDLSSVKDAAIASLPAALQVVYGVLAKFVGDPNTPAMLPAQPGD
jgi:hypothetical protein